ncbi:MAG: hypothetical protein ACLFN5_01455 [bacterium]
MTGGAIGLVLFLLLLLALYLTFSSEQKEYEKIDDVMGENREADKDHNIKAVLWKGTINGYPVTILRGVDFKDSRRMLTIAVATDCSVEMRLDPYNILRGPSRALSEFWGKNQRVKFDGPLKDFLLYTKSPNEAQRIINVWNTDKNVEMMRKFHHITFEKLDEGFVKGWFYQLDVNLEEIKERAQTLVELVLQTELKPGDPQADPNPPRR